MIGAHNSSKIPDSEIDSMNFDAARVKLDELISKARAKSAGKSNASPANTSSPENDTSQDADEADGEEMVVDRIRERVTLGKADYER